MQLAQVKELEKKYLLGTYSRYELLADRGSGAYLIDKSNKRYLDLLAQHLLDSRVVVAQRVYRNSGKEIEISFIRLVNQISAASAVGE